MDIHDIDNTIYKYMENNEIAGCSLMVRKNENLEYSNIWGYSNIEKKMPVTYDSIFRIMSMTKIITAVGIMKLYEEGKLYIDDPLSKYIPSFKDMKVSTDKRYAYHENMKPLEIMKKVLFFNMDKVKKEPANREITIRDLLSHSSGLAQGVVGLIAMMKDKSIRESLSQEAEKYSHYVLDFQPGTGTGYSPLAGFDMLTRVIEVVSGMEASEYFKKRVFEPLDMKDTCFKLNNEQKKRLVSVYIRKKDKLIDCTGTKSDMDGMLKRGDDYVCGSGGAYSTIMDYDNLASMLSNNGGYNGKRFLKPETVQLMYTEAPKMHLEPDPGTVWGLGVRIWQDPIRNKSVVTPGTYGWSGAFGTHFFVSPKDNLSCVFMVNRSDLNGSGSYISRKIEELVFGIFRN